MSVSGAGGSGGLSVLGLAAIPQPLKAQGAGLSFGALRLVHLPEWRIALFTSFGNTVSEAKYPAMWQHPGHGRTDATGVTEAIIA
jgi:hypothetical protein